jgi:formylglycine-generating enzyme required for sulfatase activity
MRPVTVLYACITFMSCSVFLNKKVDKAPPGTVLLKEGLYIDKTEIGNVHWREFSYWILQFPRDTAFHWQMMPDTSVWKNIEMPLTEYYYRHPGYNYYPVVGISHEQAVEFCRWRSDRVNELYQKNPSQNPLPGKKYRYRLPTNEEWELAASGKLDVREYPYGYKSTIGTKGIWKGHRLFNYYSVRDTAKLKDRAALTAEVTSYLPNGYGIYNLIGNLSEMISEKGIAKGGNYTLPLEKCKVTEQQIYTKPEAWLGFRCVCEVID